MFATRLKLARKKSGLTLSALSTRLEGLVPTRDLGRYERGEMLPSSRILVSLSEVLGEPLRYFMGQMCSDLARVDYRKKSATRAQDRARVEAAVLDHADRYLTIESILGLDSVRWDAPFEPIVLSSLDGAEQLAIDVRKEWELGIDPIPDMTELLEEHGIKVMGIDLPDEVSGLTCLVSQQMEESDVPVIVVNKGHSVERRRLTLAHELAHRLLDPDSPVDKEKAAMRFAGAFLMPLIHLRREAGSRRNSLGCRELMELKHIYRVSAAAVLVRLQQAGIISRKTMRHFLSTIGRKWRKEEPLPIEDDTVECAGRYERLCFRALSERIISYGKVAELLGRPLARIHLDAHGTLPDT